MKIEFSSTSWESAQMKATRIMPKVFVLPVSIIDLQNACARYSVQGSNGNFYRVTFWEDSDRDFCSVCNCPAGQKGFNCYHVASAWFLHSAFVRNRVRPTFDRIKRLQASFLLLIFRIFVCASRSGFGCDLFAMAHSLFFRSVLACRLRSRFRAVRVVWLRVA